MRIGSMMWGCLRCSTAGLALGESTICHQVFNSDSSSWRPDPQGTDALVQDGLEELCGLCKSSLVPDAWVLQEVQAQETTIVIVNPTLANTSLILTVDGYAIRILLPQSSPILMPSPNSEGVIPNKMSQVIMCKVSDDISRQVGFQKKLSSLSCPHGGTNGC